MTWAVAEQAVIDGLTAISGIVRVYKNPPAQIQDTPCFIMYPPSFENVVGPSFRARNYELPVECLVSDEDPADAAGLINTYRELLIPAFDSDVTLNGGATMAYVKSGTRGVGLEYPRGSGKMYAGFEATIYFEIKEGVNFSV